MNTFFLKKLYSNYQNLPLRKKVGIYCLISIILFNQFTWLYIFDQDGYLKSYKKFILLLINLFQLIAGTTFIFSDLRPKLFLKSIVYFIYLVSIIELSSYILIKIIFHAKVGLEEQINHYTSDNVSLMVPDLRSDYKPNSEHEEINIHGFRFGGKPHSKDSYRIMCIGGSTTWGDGAPDSIYTYPAQLEIYLNSKGYNVNVINAGVPYHTSLDVLMRFVTKGIYYRPDMLLIHTGLNDCGPVLSPYDYKPDYTHWRDVGFSEDRLFKNLWHDFPFSFARLFFIYAFDFELDNTLSHQTSYGLTELLANSEINYNRVGGLKNYFSSIMTIAQANKITPVTILINDDHERTNSYTKKVLDSEKKINYGIERTRKCVTLNNSIMDSISKVNNVKIIPFNKFEPSTKDHWLDHCHLNADGIKEKARFIGDFLIKEYSLRFE